MKAHRSLFCLLVLVIACADDEKPAARTSEEFCQAWASAACSTEVISVCQAASAEECRQSQEDFCRTLVPAKTFSDAKGDACLAAVKAAYQDADLASEELATVLTLAEPCDTIIAGPKQRGDSCSDRSECDASAGYECVKKADTGAIEAKEVGDDCKIQEECDATGFCNEGKCAERFEVSEPCGFDEQCSNGICYAFEGTKTCTDRIRLSRAEPICATFR
ncbi:MAG: hypothetical protein RL701_2464 [Pseudomonadota bacterium]